MSIKTKGGANICRAGARHSQAGARHSQAGARHSQACARHLGIIIDHDLILVGLSRLYQKYCDGIIREIDRSGRD